MDVDDLLLISKFWPGLRDCAAGWRQWVASLPGGKVTYEILTSFFNDEAQQRKWLKRRKVDFHPELTRAFFGGEASNIVVEEVYGPEEGTNIGWLCFYGGKSC